MTVKEDIKSLLAKESWTITKMAQEMTKCTGKNYNVKTLSQKLTNGTLRYEEYKTIINILGFRISLERMKSSY